MSGSDPLAPNNAWPFPKPSDTEGAPKKFEPFNLSIAIVSPEEAFIVRDMINYALAGRLGGFSSVDGAKKMAILREMYKVLSDRLREAGVI